MISSVAISVFVINENVLRRSVFSVMLDSINYLCLYGLGKFKKRLKKWNPIKDPNR